MEDAIDQESVTWYSVEIVENMGHSPLAIGFPERRHPADLPLPMYLRSSPHRHHAWYK
jgi:hypothetical protein